MNKDEILAKSRSEKQDEGVEYIASHGRRYGVVGMTAMFLLLAIYNLYHGDSCNQILAMYWTYLGFESWGRYRVDHRPFRLVLSIIGVCAGIAWADLHILS